jgi:hypothetical protein
MIDRQGGQIIIECDSCEEAIAGDEDDGFGALWKDAKSQGWRARKIADEWLHGCPRCGPPT